MTDYQFFKSIHVCVKCHKRQAEPNITRCKECNEKQNMYQNQTRNFLKKIGICPVCRKEKLFGEEKQCLDCREKSYERKLKYNITDEKKQIYRENFKKQQKELYKERSKKGICTRCGKRKADTGRKKCKVCLNKDAEMHRLKRIKKD